jgi:glyoxylase-like metal-dependent hydrolase (beta-lactamase superfamily II)
MATVKVLLIGYFEWIKKDICRASSTVIFIEDGKEKIIVDTGNACDANKIIKALKKIKVKPEEITIVVNTHTHSDHNGSNFIFKKAKFIDGEGMYKDDEFYLGDIDNFSLTKNIKIIKTPGHTLYDCSLLVKTKEGIVAVVGDLFWTPPSLRFGEAKRSSSFITDKKLYKKSQEKVLKNAQWIIPGHGDIFEV